METIVEKTGARGIGPLSEVTQNEININPNVSCNIYIKKTNIGANLPPLLLKTKWRFNT